MKKILFALLVTAGGTLSATAQAVADVAHTLRIDSTDTPQMIVEKAVRIVPTPQQKAALENEFIAFIHFGPNTFTRREWGTGKENPAVFDLHTLDTDQWVQAMKAAGMKMVIFTAKHHDGFVLWQSRYTDHGIMSSPFRDGKGDVLADLAASCKKYGLKLGVYLSPADLYQIENPDGLYGNLSEKTLRTIPRMIENRPFADTTRFEFEVDDYNEYFLNQLYELLTEYGPIHEVWFDGAHPKRKGGQTYNYPAWRELIRTLAPEAVIFGREDVRWCGNEAGGTRDTEWNVVAYDGNPDTMTVFRDMTDADLGSRTRLAQSPYIHYQQAETNTSIREGWFYRDDERQGVRSADDVFDIYERSVGGNSTFLLNIPPNRDGLFSDRDVEVLEEVGRRIESTYGEGTDVFAGATVTERQDMLEIKLPEAATFNRIVLQEPISETGERIESVAVDALIYGQWQQVAAATNVGYKRILRFPDITTDQVRIRIVEARATPYLSHISAHRYASRPPMLTISQSATGEVTIEPSLSTFAWKSHGENAAENLNGGYVIHYTTDGTTPDITSAVYATPFTMGRGVVNAVAELNGELGAITSAPLGYIKSRWTVAGVSSESRGREASKAFDGDPSTFWYSGPEEAGWLAVDLGQEEEITGFSYTPHKAMRNGMMASGKLQTSPDGENWTTVDAFEFGNLINDPSRRYHYLSTPVRSRYVRISAESAAGEGKGTAIAEIDIF